MGGIGEGVATVEAVVLLGIVVMMSVPMEAVVLIEELMIGIITTRGAGGLEVLDAEEDEVEALEGGGIEALLERVVLKEELRLSSGTGRGSKQNLVTELTAETLEMTGTITALRRMEVSMMTLSTSRSLMDTTADPLAIIWFVPTLLV